MTAAKIRQAARVVTAATPLAEVADVLGVSRTTLYRHLQTTQSDGTLPTPARAPGLVPVVLVVGERSLRVCSSCGDEPGTRQEEVALRADLAVRWLRPDPDNPGSVLEARHCRACQQRGLVVDVECARCARHQRGAGVGQRHRTGSVAHLARRWLGAAGWVTAPELVCPTH